MTSYRKSHVGEKYGERYDAHHASRVDAIIWDTFIKPFVRQELVDLTGAGLCRYLDFACGTGRLLKVGHSVFGQSTGIDVSEDMLAVSRQRVPEAKLVQVDVTRNPPQDLGGFDCVTLFRFILNAEDDLRMSVLHWISEHTVKGGTLILNNHRNSASIKSFLTWLAFWQPPSARHRLSRKQVEEMLDEAGFLVERCEGFSILPSVLGRPIFGRKLQIKIEKFLLRLGLGRFGSELVVVARKR